ncbi:NAD(P)-binding protein [Trichoderma citrinoviride]|uniref:NAD(P)-binding protein n=1 Tax=Trichoderma citrinoviride TaxID=58853 RepID=A0A2T4AXH4_9HYPO|nr:NAD(P)-binding protein [Trichoderma citrinoviride]PTB61749.1 NAD(P)-binding protein [Trichoderma citrinoviride]
MANNSASTIYVITGGNRGLGLGLVKSLLARTNTTVIATVRNDEAASTLQEETATDHKGPGSILLIAQLDFSAVSSPVTIRDAFKFDIDHVDVLINNAGGTFPMVPAAETTARDLRAAFEVNTIAPLLVFQALWPLLKKSQAPKLIMMTSSVGSIGEMEPVPGGAYGPSKAAQNWLTRALHLETKNSGLVTIALHPGWVQTRAGQFVADQWGFPSGPPDTIESSVEAILKIIDEASEETSGKFITQQGQILRW